jgi:hypothetical protein
MIGTYKLVKGSQLEDFTRPYVWKFPLQSDKSIGTSDIGILRSHSLFLFKNLGPLRVAIQEKGMYAVGHNHWLPMFRGTDDDYKTEVQNWLVDNWYPICNVLGEEFDFQTTLFLASVHLDVWGEFYLYLTESEEGYPMIQIVPPYRIDQPRQTGAIDGNSKLTGNQFGGQFKGRKIEMGVVKNDQGRAIGFHVLGDDADGNQDQLVPASDIIRVRELDMGDETRATPTLSHGINQGRSILSLMENEQSFLEDASRINLLEWNEIGGLDPSDPQNLLSVMQGQPGSVITDNGGTATNPPPVNGSRVSFQEWKEKGQTRYFNAKDGSKLQAFQFNRPAQEWSTFMDKLGRFLIDPIWPYYLVDREADLGGAQCRGLLARANRIIQDRQSLLRRVARRAVGYAVAKGSKVGRIPANEQWWMWDFSLPARITVDFGRDSKSELLQIEGEILDAAETIEARGAGSYEDFLLRFYRNQALKIKIKAQVEKETGITLADVPLPVISGSEPAGGSGE